MVLFFREQGKPFVAVFPGLGGAPGCVWWTKPVIPVPGYRKSARGPA